MGRMRVGVWGLGILVLLLLSPAGSEALWSGKKDPEAAPTAADAAKEYARQAVRNTADAASNVGKRDSLSSDCRCRVLLRVVNCAGGESFICSDYSLDMRF